MRQIVICVAVVLASLVSGCGGGGGGGGGGNGPLNAYEMELVGNYTLVGFEVRKDGVWYDSTDFYPWDGDLSLYPDRSAYAYLLIVDSLREGDFEWRATQYQFYDGYNLANYTFDGVVLTTDWTDPSTNDREIQYWRKNGF